MTDSTTSTQSAPNSSSATYTALSSIAPAIASTACCWGPAALSVFAGGAAASSSSAAALHKLSRYRPHLLTLSATMISYSFYNVYGPPSQRQHACCHTEAERQAHERNMRISRGVVWASLGVALAGASYGRVRLPSSSLSMLSTNATRTAGSAPIAASTPVMSGNNTSSIAFFQHHFQVEGMQCGGCFNTVKKAIENVEGVQHVVIGHDAGTVVVKGRADMTEIQKAIEKAGFRIVGGSGQQPETSSSCH